ncbi:MAG: universal stress protein [Actinobacteria bacterium]|nr:universal stress protein [Actinomycetota bacterium]
MADLPARVVVGVDGSEGSIEALRWAAHEAARRQWQLHVVTCAQLPVAVEAGMVGAGAFAGSTMDAIIKDEEAVNQRAVDLARSLGVSVKVSGDTVLGAPGYALVSAATEHDLLVVGATGHPGRLSDILGSVATVAAHRAKCPVVVVHGVGRPDYALTRIVVGIDGSAGSDNAICWAVEQAIRSSAELVLVHGWIYPYVGSRSSVSEPRDEMRLDAMRTLEAAVVKVHGLAPGLRCQSIITEESAAKAVIDAAADADLVVVGSRGHGGFSALLLGSVSRSVVQHASCPVAVIRTR